MASSLLHFLALLTAAYCLGCSDDNGEILWLVTTVGNVSVRANDTKVRIANESFPVLNLLEINCFLEELELNSCGIKEIQPGAFVVNVTDVILQQVIITGNEIHGIREGIFNDLPVSVLRIPNNKITVIESGAFNNNTFLETIDLSNNELTLLDPLWFTGCTKLSEFSIVKNKIENIYVTAFQTLIRNGSVIIRLSTNILRDFDPLLLKNYDDVEILDMSNNYLKELDEALFKNRTIRRLEVENNNLTCVPNSIFQANVTVLNIMRNMYMSCDCLKKLKEWEINSGVSIFYPSIICEDKQKEVMVVYNANTTSVIPVPRPEYKGIPLNT